MKPCATCKEELGAANLQKEKWREEAIRQRSRLADLFGDIDRPKWSKPTTMRVYLLSANFVLAWRGFVRGHHAGKADIAASALPCASWPQQGVHSASTFRSSC